MRRRGKNQYLIWFGIWFILISAHCIAEESRAEKRVFMSVSGSERRADPVVILDAKKYTSPSINNVPDYLTKGHKFFLYVEGVQVGTIQLGDPIGGECDGVKGIDVSIQSKESFRYGLATNKRLPKSNDHKIKITPADETRLSEMARELFIKGGVAPSLIEKMQGGHKRFLAVETDRKTEFIGNFSVQDRPDPEHSLDVNEASIIFIAEKTNDMMLPIFLKLFTNLPDDQDGVNREIYSLIDTLDLDNDGLCEIIIRSDGYEGFGFNILKRLPNGWTDFYQGGGNGC